MINLALVLFGFIGLLVVVLMQSFKILHLQNKFLELENRFKNLQTGDKTATRVSPKAELISQRTLGRSTDKTELEVKSTPEPDTTLIE